MAFSVGDKVMHPSLGAGQITGEEHRVLLSEFKHYYVIKVMGTKTTVYVPISKMDELGIRLVMSPGKLRQVLGTLESVPSPLSNDYKKRQARVQEKLETGLSIPTAEVVRDLTWHGKRKHLTQGDEALLRRGRERLVAEMACAADVDAIETHELLDGTLRTALANGLEAFEVV
jgi:CarD family transcriptional regulator